MMNLPNRAGDRGACSFSNLPACMVLSRPSRVSYKSQRRLRFNRVLPRTTSKATVTGCCSGQQNHTAEWRRNVYPFGTGITGNPMTPNWKSAGSTTRRHVLQAAGMASTLSAGCFSLGTDSPSTFEFSEGFEADLPDWKTGSDVPEDPNNPGNPVNWDITRSTERAATGSSSLRYFLDGRQDDGTIWIARPVSVEADQAYQVRMQADGWSASESFNTLAYLVMYAETSPPKSEGSFPEPGANSTNAGVSKAGGLREVLNQ